MSDIMTKFMAILTREEKREFTMLSVLLIVAALAETVSIALILPILNMTMDKSVIRSNEILNRIFTALGFEDNDLFIVTCSGALIIVFILKGVFLYKSKRYEMGVLYRTQVRISKDMLESIIRREYIQLADANSAGLFNDVYTISAGLVNRFISPLLQFAGEFLIVGFITLFLISMEPIATLSIMGIFALFTLAYVLIMRNKIRRAGELSNKYSALMISWIQQLIENIKYIKIRQCETFFITNYENASKEFVINNEKSKLFDFTPKIVIEIVALVGILMVLIYTLLSERSSDSMVKTLGIFGIAAIRLMPSVNRLIGMYNTTRFNLPKLNRVYKSLRKQFAHHEEICADPIDYSGWHSIEISELTYSYNEKKQIINGLNMSIQKGEIIGIVGRSGTGKSTLLDLIVGLLKPKSGDIIADSVSIFKDVRSWQKQVSYIPQSTYLINGNLIDNITLGEPVNFDYLDDVVERAQLVDFVKSHPEGLKTEIGDRGIKMSGGQRQRLAIARALYQNASILILDEATSALDKMTEDAFMDAVYKLKGSFTIIIVAHRTSTLSRCDRILDLDIGVVHNQIGFDEA